MSYQNDKELNSNSNRLNILSRIKQYKRGIFTNILPLSVALFLIFWSNNPELGNIIASLSLIMIIAIIMFIILLSYFQCKRNKITLSSKINVFVQKYGSKFIFNLLIYSIFSALFIALFPSSYEFLTEIMKDIRCYNIVNSLFAVLKVFIFPLALGLFLRWYLIWIEDKEAECLKTFKKSKKYFFMLIISRSFMLILVGLFLSRAFNQDIAKETHNTAPNDPLISVIFSNTSLSVNDGLSVKYFDTSLKLNSGHFISGNTVQECDVNSKVICDRWLYTMLVMLYLGYEILTPYIMDFLKNKYKGEDNEDTNENKQKKANEKVNEEKIETVAQIALGNLTEETKASSETEHGPLWQRNTTKKKSKEKSKGKSEKKSKGKSKGSQKIKYS